MEGNKKDPENMGITSRLVKDVFDRIDQADVALVFMVKVSYVEIYLEKVRDLLNSQNSNLRVRETKDRGGRCSDRGQQQQRNTAPRHIALHLSRLSAL
jgi:kinesin family protein 5